MNTQRGGEGERGEGGEEEGERGRTHVLLHATFSIVKAAETIVRHDSPSWPIALTTKVPRMGSSNVLEPCPYTKRNKLCNGPVQPTGYVTTWYCIRMSCSVLTNILAHFEPASWSMANELSPAGPWLQAPSGKQRTLATRENIHTCGHA